MSAPIFRLDEVTFAYPGRPRCIESVSFSLGPGERLGLLGANGSGKSTLLHILDGLFFPSSGKVEAFGGALTEETLADPEFGPRFRGLVGFLFQNSDAQLFCPTVEEELAFGPLQMDLSAREVERRVADTMALLGIGHLRGRVPAALSAGEKKRVALASLLTLGPSVLLLDEPTAGLDPRSQDALLEILEALNGRGVALVTATHDLTILPHLSDRALVLGEDHRIAAAGAVGDILGNTDLLLRVNLIHAHRHRHGDHVHAHPHYHVVGHEHTHDRDGAGHPRSHDSE